MSNGGKDTIYNVVGVCANCHRRLHVLNDKADYEENNSGCRCSYF
ncbi:HNH endonuclease [Bacillus nitratireducens]|nr:HNH endonuclease [Bacillus nitratireducens]UNP79062.1 HNH endonuclease [Bacillus nitratireducens]